MKLEEVIAYDTRANQPEAANVPVGTLYCVSDEGGAMERSNGTTWNSVASASSGTGNIGKQLTMVADTSVTSPTFAQTGSIDSIYFQGWLPDYNYYTQSGGYYENALYIKPTGQNIFGSDNYDYYWTGSTEPVWSTAPNAGDWVGDNDHTWFNTGVAALSAPATWQADFAYDDYTPDLVWPTTPNGHLYMRLPTYAFAGGTSGSSEPTWTLDRSYASDNSGYWVDLGPAVKLGWRHPVFVEGGYNGASQPGTSIARENIYFDDGQTINGLSSIQSGVGEFSTSYIGGLGLGIAYTGRIAMGVTHLGSSDVRQIVNLGSTDPSAGGGVTAEIGSIGMRNNSGTAELWQKTGSSATQWTKRF